MGTAGEAFDSWWGRETGRLYSEAYRQSGACGKWILLFALKLGAYRNYLGTLGVAFQEVLHK